MSECARCAAKLAPARSDRAFCSSCAQHMREHGEVVHFAQPCGDHYHSLCGEPGWAAGDIEDVTCDVCIEKFWNVKGQA